jgi:ribonucleoside-triphosphate reductase
LTLREVIKRDGGLEPFDIERIITSITWALEETGEGTRRTAEYLAQKVVEQLPEVASVETIQDKIVETLRGEGYSKTADAFSDYRKRHDELRVLRSVAFDTGKMVSDYLELRDWRVRENANISPSYSGLMFNTAGAIQARWLLDKYYPAPVADAHISGDLHLHDLYMGATNYCLGWSVEDILLRGIEPIGTNPKSNPPKHLDVLTMQMVNFVGMATQESAGAQAFNSVDVLLSPFVHYDGLDERKLRQIIQMFIYNLNICSRWGGQSPFTNITLSITVPEDLKNKPAIIGGKPTDRTYGDFEEETRMVARAFLEVLLEGDAQGRPFTFPIPTIGLTKDFPWDSEISDLLWRVTAKYGLPYFQNFINSDLNPSDVRSMCCHLMLNLSELRRNVTGGLFGSADKTGSIGVVTINIPRIGYLSKGDEDKFFRLLEQRMRLARRSLLLKRKLIQRNMDAGLLPLTKTYLGTLQNHFNTIGLVGVHEACLNFGLENGIIGDDGRGFAIKILEFMRERVREFQQEDGVLYNLEATPAEGTSYRLARLDRKRFPDIRASGKREPFYTGSTLLPAYHEINLVDALRHQEPLQTLYTGGTVWHFYLGESPEPRATALLMRRACENFRIPYYSITPTYSICPNHGYLAGENWKCPTCGADCDVYSRVVGYFRPVKNWNAGKQEEFRQRKFLKI